MKSHKREKPNADSRSDHAKQWTAFNSKRWQKTLRVFRNGRIKLPRILTPILLIYYVLSGCTPLELWPTSPLSMKAGTALALILMGIAIRIWSRGHHVRNTLYTSGPYAIVQHPLYLGTFLISYGVCLILNSWLLTLVYLVYFIVFYTATILSEEMSMFNTFGPSYAAYFSRTPSIIPFRFSGIHLQDLGGWSLREFYKTTELRSSLLYLCIPLFLMLLPRLLTAFQTWRSGLI